MTDDAGNDDPCPSNTGSNGALDGGLYHPGTFPVMNLLSFGSDLLNA